MNMRYEPFLEGDIGALESEPEIGLSEAADDLINSFVDIRRGGAAAARKEPSLRFDTIKEIAEMNVRLANASFHAHVRAFAAAKSDDERKALEAGLTEAEMSARFADQAAQHVRRSEAMFRGATLHLVLGNEAKAAESSAQAAAILGAAAQDTANFASRAPRSRFFEPALRLLYAADNAIGEVQQRSVEFRETMKARAAAFPAAMGHIARRIIEFRAVLADSPRMVKELAVREGVHHAKSAAIISRNIVIGTRLWFGKKTDEAKAAVKETRAWQAFTSAVAYVREAAQAVGDHAKAAASLAGGAITLAKEAYRAELNDVREQRVAAPARP